jgi:SAM-dependent methyltransferase
MFALSGFFSEESSWPAIVARAINKLFYSVGLGASYSRYQETFYLYSSFADRSLYSKYSNNSVFVNLGSGCFSHPFWTCYDYPGQSRYYQRIQGKEDLDYFAIDLCSSNVRLPYDNNSVDLIYCSHTLEHLELQSGIKLLGECFRVMKPGSVLRTCLPNTAEDVIRLRDIYDRQGLGKEQLEELISTVIYNTFTPAMHLFPDVLLSALKTADWDVNKFINHICLHHGISASFNPREPGNHISYWDLARLTEVADNIGFQCSVPQYKNITVAHPFKNPAVFDSTEPQLSFYCELIK